MSEGTAYLAVFGDTHGHLRLMLQLCRLWQLNHGRWLDGVLICGDLGFYPDVNRLDKATTNYARRDPEELGFAQYFREPEPVQRDALVERILLGGDEPLEQVTCPILWCPGNHEAFDELEKATGGAPLAAVDAYRAFTHLDDGRTTEVAGVTIGAVGGAPEPVEAHEAKGDPRKYVDERACNRLLGRPFDVLLTHGSPRGIGGESDHLGSFLLRDLVELNQPAYHFFAHHTSPIEPAMIGATQCYWLNDVAFEGARRGRFGVIEAGCMGLLEWRSGSDHSFSLNEDAWLQAVTGDSWKHL